MEAGSKQPQDRAVSGQQRSQGAEADTRERERDKTRSSVPRRLDSAPLSPSPCGAATLSPTQSRTSGSSREQSPGNAPQSAHPSGRSQTRPSS